ncbi:MAG: S9 family peptidase [Gammaproteobacteria bacterium]|nr:S9 family peptidase [Gammaproteobacteria bacterium]
MSRTLAAGCLITVLCGPGGYALGQAPPPGMGPPPVPALPATDDPAELKRLWAAQLDATRWERGQLEKQADDLRIALAAKGVLDYRKIEYRSADGLSIPAYLFQPLTPAAGRRPAVIFVHGSQHGQFNSRSYPRVAELVQRGYLVLAPDYRSSSGYTKAFHDAADYGGREIDDMLAAGDFLAALPGVDPARIAILGQSHGGYNVLMALARQPGKFAAGVDFFGPTDLVWRLTAPAGANANTDPGDREYFAGMVGKPIDEAPELYRARSPRHLAKDIRDPLLILHGDRDAVVSVQESLWLDAALKEAGNNNHSLHVIRDGQHGYPAPQMDEMWRLTFGFLQETLGH